jgi:hypothetical protein
MYSVLCALILLSIGDYKQRVRAEHYLKTGSISFEYGKAWYDNTDCPEFRVRMKRVLWVKWCMETQEKYGHSENYYYNEEVMKKLQRKDFDKELER